MNAVSIHNVVKKYDDIVALNNISLEIYKGELFGLIGPDGAGKSTLFRILTTLLEPDSGEAFVTGSHVVNDLKAIRSKVGYMPGKFSLYQDLSVEENLTFFATIFGTSIEENYDLIRDIYIQIEPFKKRYAGKLSGGMKQKLALCCALIHKPEVLFLDEPTTGVDAVSRKEFWEMLLKLKAKGISILVSTPYMDEASLCDRIALIQKGEILSIDEPKALINTFSKPLYAVKAENFYGLLMHLKELSLTESVLPFGEYLHWITKEEINVELFLNESKRIGFRNLEILSIEPSIEDVFLDLAEDIK